MDKINLKEEAALEKIRSFFNSEDMSEEEISSVLEELSEDEKEDFLDYLYNNKQKKK